MRHSPLYDQKQKNRIMDAFCSAEKGEKELVCTAFRVSETQIRRWLKVRKDEQKQTTSAPVSP